MNKRSIAIVVLLAAFAIVGWARPTVSISAAPQASCNTKKPSHPARTSSQHVVLDVHGSGQASTKKFSVPSEWQLHWSYDCRSFGSTGNFMVDVDGGSSGYGIPEGGVNELGWGKSGVSYEHESGTFYLAINSECSWHVWVTR